jgi:diguanylate cyclase (GGDEF)-like protein
LKKLLPTLAGFAPVACILLAAYLLVPRMAELPASLSGLRVYGPYFMLALGMLVSIAFRRGRVLFALLTLALAYASLRFYLQYGLNNFHARAVFAALCLFVPMNLAVLGLLKERGAFNRHGLQRLAFILAQILFTVWVLYRGNVTAVDAFYAPLIDARFLALPPLPQAALAAIGLGLIVTLGTWLAARTPVNLGIAGALAAFAIAASKAAAPDSIAVFTAAGALILTVAVLQDTYRMAFRDELTALPSRRAMNESLAALGRHYTLAMVDVDHFKSINDIYGHDTGDQVLKMVATHLAQTGGGGSAFRYGGEEFALLFPGRNISAALPYLEALRKNIADYDMAVRTGDRAVQTKAGKKQGGGKRGGKTVSVTISIGVAECNDRLLTPEEVIQAADKALYRAKRGGRNRVNR